MGIISLIYSATGALLVLFFLLFAIISIFENRFRAAIVSFAIAISFAVIWLGLFFALRDLTAFLIIPVIILALLTVLFLAPQGKVSKIAISNTGEKVDERDIMFAREEYKPGDRKYDIYYSMRPENREIDDRLRKLPEILEPGGKYYERDQAELIKSIFENVESYLDRVDGKIAEIKQKTDPADITAFLKGRIIEMGAIDAGVARLRQEYLYSHVGRGPEQWGSEIKNNHRFAIMFSLEMDYDQVDRAPRLPITGESAGNYLKGAVISVEMAKHIRELGYSARAHIAGSNYRIMLPPVAYDAGLGELGRMGYLISPKTGARIRLGAVTTELELIPDTSLDFGVQDFCEKCLKCAVNCPSGAITRDGKTTVRGVEKWQLDIDKCIRYWRIAGTDCGLCMKVCPYSHPATFIHNIVRKAASRSGFARRASIFADDLFYGKKARI